MDVLFAAFGPQAETDRWLSEAIASLREFGSNLGRVVVAGIPVPGLPDSVERFPVPPMVARGSRYDNATDAILRAIESEVFRSPFLYGPPGARLSAPTDLDAYPFLMRRDRIKSVADLIRENKGGAVVTRYRLVLSDTRSALERNGCGAAETTGPFFAWIDPSDASEVKRIWLEEPHGEFGYDPCCLFGNLRARRLGMCPQMADSAAKPAEMPPAPSSPSATH